MGIFDGMKLVYGFQELGSILAHQRKGANSGHKWKILQVSKNINWLFEEERLKEIKKQFKYKCLLNKKED